MVAKMAIWSPKSGHGRQDGDLVVEVGSWSPRWRSIETLKLLLVFLPAFIDKHSL
jgi:hypothetical protein